jgi:L-arabinose isomerase
VPAYAYELRRGDQIVATGHMKEEDPLVVGDRVVIGGHRGIVHEVSPQMVGGKVRVVVQFDANVSRGSRRNA